MAIQLLPVLLNRTGNCKRLGSRTEPGQPNQEYTGMSELTPEDQFTKILVGREQECPAGLADRQNLRIWQPWLEFGDVVDFMAVASQAVDDLSIDVLVGDKPQPATFSTG